MIGSWSLVGEVMGGMYSKFEYFENCIFILLVYFYLLL